LSRCDGAQSHKSSALSPPLGKLAQEKTCHVGQITCICSSSQEFSPRRETGRGLFDSDGDPHSRALSPPRQRIAPEAPPRVVVRTSRPPATPAGGLLALRKTTNHHKEASMTAWLILLSLTGLMAIAVREALA
jgi:hypothetical protein